MASFYKRKLRDSFVWEVKIRRKGYPIQFQTFSNRAGAEKWTRKIESEIDGGIFVSRKEAENTTLSEALDRYEREVIPAKKGAKQESVRIRTWEKTPLAFRFLATIQGKDIATYRDERLKEVASNTARHELALLSHLFTIAVKEWGMTGLVNPVRQIRMPKMPAGRDRRLKPGEFDRIIAASKSDMLPPVSRLALETGMRQAEIAEITWNRVDLKKEQSRFSKLKMGRRELFPYHRRRSKSCQEFPAGLTERCGTFFLPQRLPLLGAVPLQEPGRPMKRNAKKGTKNRIPNF